jgi:hypothetical protein
MPELHDEATLAASITRAVNLFKRANVPAERWDGYLYEARSITQERSASITKQRDRRQATFALKNKAPYYFAVLEGLLGLREEPTRPSPPVDTTETNTPRVRSRAAPTRSS